MQAKIIHLGKFLHFILANGTKKSRKNKLLRDLQLIAYQQLTKH
jgi:hypothetical protein